ncbi:MAG: hypothetical protein ACR2FF_05095 [Mycobacteriales bacterium]
MRFGEGLVAALAAEARRRAPRAEVRTGLDPAPAVRVEQPGEPSTATFVVEAIGADRVLVRIGELASVEVCYGADPRILERDRDDLPPEDAAVADLVEWLDAVLDGRVSERIWVSGDAPVRARAVVTWRDGSTTTVFAPADAGVLAAGDRSLDVDYAAYDQR